MTSMQHRLIPLAAATALFMAPVAHAASPAVAPLLAQEAKDGPRALLDGLERLLAQDPGLAATPQTATALARAAAAPVPDFVGANLPVYREIVEKITAAAPPDQRAAVRRAVSLEIAGYIATDIRIMPPPMPLTQGNIPAQAPGAGGPGFTLGSFTITPSLQGGMFYDDNIYATRSGKVSDGVGTLSPRVTLRSNWTHNALYAEAGADLTGYLHHGNENTNDWHTLAEGRIDVNDRTRIVLGGLALMEHEDRSSPDAVEGFVPTRYWETDGYVGILHRIGNFNIRAGGAVERLTFANVQSQNGEINNHDRNRNRYTFGIRVRDDAKTDLRPFIEGLGDLRRYDHTPDDFGYQRNSDGYRASFGALFRIQPNLSGEASIGIMARYYADPRFKNVITPAASANLRWQAGDNTAMLAFFDRSIEETTLAGSPAYVYSVIGGRIEQTLLPDLTGFLRLAFAHSNFWQSSRWDNEADMSVGVRYYLTDTYYIGADYRYTQRVSGDSAVNFTRNEAFLSFGSAF